MGRERTGRHFWNFIMPNCQIILLLMGRKSRSRSVVYKCLILTRNDFLEVKERMGWSPGIFEKTNGWVRFCTPKNALQLPSVSVSKIESFLKVISNHGKDWPLTEIVFLKQYVGSSIFLVKYHTECPEFLFTRWKSMIQWQFLSPSESEVKPNIHGFYGIIIKNNFFFVFN